MIAKTVILRCPPGRAFTIFTEKAGAWWPDDLRHTNVAASVIRIQASGRFFERANDGTEVELGVVRVFEPASRLVIDWFPGSGSEHPTQVEIRFEPAAGGTLVTISHDAGTAGIDIFSKNASRYARSWDRVLACVARYD